MSGRNPPQNLGELLRQPNFGQSRDLDKPGDPITPVQLYLDVTLIRRYEQDPRHHANPQFDEIKASILAQGGLNNPLTVTRRPGEEHYIIEAGGNTRLRALQELWQETGDERFHYTHVLFKPWESESTILTRHLIENELRGEMLYVDKARGVEALRRLWAKESGLEDLTRNEFQRRLKTAGFKISARAISRLRFTAQIAELLPQATAEASFGREVIEQIMTLYSAAQRYWLQHGLDEGAFQSEWDNALVQADSPEFSLIVVEQTLARVLSNWINKDPSSISLDIDLLAYENQHNPPQPESQGQLHASDAVSSYPLQNSPLNEDEITDSTQPEVSLTGIDSSPSDSMDWMEDPDPSPAAAIPQTSQATTAQSVMPKPDADLADSHANFTSSVKPSPILNRDIKSLRARAGVLAQRIAQHHRMGPIATPTARSNYGYILVDLPHLEDDEDTTKVTMPVWWLLYSLCHQEHVDAGLLHQHAPADSLLRELSPACDPLEIAQKLMEMTPPLSGPLILRAVAASEGRGWQDIVDLMATYRELRSCQLQGGTK